MLLPASSGLRAAEVSGGCFFPKRTFDQVLVSMTTSDLLQSKTWLQLASRQPRRGTIGQLNQEQEIWSHSIRTTQSITGQQPNAG